MNCIKVKVKFMSPYFQALTGVEEEEITIKDGTTVKDLLKKISVIHDHKLYEQLLEEETTLKNGVLIIINGKVIQDVNSKLRDGDIIIITIAHGGG